MERKKAKIGIVTPFFYPHVGGVSEHTYNLWKELKRRGYTVKIIAPNIGKDEKFPEAEIIRIGQPIPVISNGSIAYLTLSLYSTSKKILSEEGFDIIHLHDPFHQFMWGFLKYHSNTVATFHIFREVDNDSILKKVLQPIGRILNNIKKVICVSKANAEIVREIFSLEKDIFIVPNGIDYERFERAKPFDELKDKFNIVFVGRVEPRKGVKYLIKAYRIFKKIVPNSRLIIVGDGMITYYKTFVSQDIEDDVFFTGKVSYDDIPRYYKTADICVFPSTRGESFGIVLLEAMASGKPVIAGSNAGYVELLDGGKYGKIVNAENWEEIARAMVELYYLKDEREKLAEIGKEKAKEYDWKNIVDKIEEIYF